MSMIAGAIGAGLSLINTVDHIPPNEVGVLVRGGRLTRKRDTPKLIRLLGAAYGYGDDAFLQAGDYLGYRGNGLAFSIPLLERRIRVNTGENRDKLEVQNITAREKGMTREAFLDNYEQLSLDAAVYSVGSTAVWRVMDHGLNPIKSLIALNDPLNKNNFAELRQTVKAISQEGVSSVMTGMTFAEMNDCQLVEEEVINTTEDMLGHYGVKLAGIEFEAPYETPWSANRRSLNAVADAIRESGSAQHSANMAIGALLSQQQDYLHANGNGNGNGHAHLDQQSMEW